jgi:hypothetical protein
MTSSWWEVLLSPSLPQILRGVGRGVLRMGRTDSAKPAPEGKLPGAAVTVAEFAAFWSDRGFSMAEAMSLMGSHSLIDEQVSTGFRECPIYPRAKGQLSWAAHASEHCFPSHRHVQGCFQGPGPQDYCTFDNSTCTDVRMFRWENHYFRDICSPNVKIRPNTGGPPAPEETPILGMRNDEFDAEKRFESCKVRGLLVCGACCCNVVMTRLRLLRFCLRTDVPLRH